MYYTFFEEKFEVIFSIN